MNKNNTKFCIGGLLLVIFAALSMVVTPARLLIASLDYVQWAFESGNAGEIWKMLGNNLIAMVVNNLPLLILGIVLLIRKPGLPTTIVAGIGALLWLITAIGQFSLPGFESPFLRFIYNLLYALVFASLVLLSLPYVTRNMDGMKKFWFLPGVLYIAYAVMGMITAFVATTSAGYGVVMAITSGISGLFGDALVAVAFFLAGRWMGNPWKAQPAYGARPGYAAPAAPAQNSDPKAQMAYYDQLYRNGQITEQAYLNIRKQLTGL